MNFIFYITTLYNTYSLLNIREDASNVISVSNEKLTKEYLYRITKSTNNQINPFLPKLHPVLMAYTGSNLDAEKTIKIPKAIWIFNNFIILGFRAKRN